MIETYTLIAYVNCIFRIDTYNLNGINYNVLSFWDENITIHNQHS